MCFLSNASAVSHHVRAEGVTEAGCGIDDASTPDKCQIVEAMGCGIDDANTLDKYQIVEATGASGAWRLRVFMGLLGGRWSGASARCMRICTAFEK